MATSIHKAGRVGNELAAEHDVGGGAMKLFALYRKGWKFETCSLTESCFENPVSLRTEYHGLLRLGRHVLALAPSQEPIATPVERR